MAAVRGTSVHQEARTAQFMAFFRLGEGAEWFTIAFAGAALAACPVRQRNTEPQQSTQNDDFSDQYHHRGIASH